MQTQFVTTEWLAEHLHDPDVIVIDASWHMPAERRDPRAEYLDGHIPGAVFFGIDDIADKTTDLPHMLPLPEQFAAQVGALGIADTDTLIIYDEIGLRSSPRAAWTFELMGARDVRILEGGGPKWRAEGRALQSGDSKRKPQVFSVAYDSRRVANLMQVAQFSQTGSRQVIDARSAERFAGTAPEPRAGLRGGHIPGSYSLPFPAVVEGGKLKPVAELREIFARAGVDLDRPVVASCGSGLTAAIIALAAEAAGATSVAIYDGSWTEWGGRDDTPVET